MSQFRVADLPPSPRPSSASESTCSIWTAARVPASARSELLPSASAASVGVAHSETNVFKAFFSASVHRQRVLSHAPRKYRGRPIVIAPQSSASSCPPVELLFGNNRTHARRRLRTVASLPRELCQKWSRRRSYGCFRRRLFLGADRRRGFADIPPTPSTAW